LKEFRLFAAFLAITGFMLLHWAVEPYPEAAENRIEMLTLVALLVLTYVAITANCIIIDHFSAFESELVSPFLYAA
jgi:hypothetical protein